MYVDEMRNEKEWEDFLTNSSEGTFYHTLAWKKVLEDSFYFQTLYLVIRDSDDAVVGICPFVIKESWPFKILDSLYDSDFGGPLIEDSYKKEVASYLGRYLEEITREKAIAYAKIRFSNANLSNYFKSRSCVTDTNTGSMDLNLEEKSSEYLWNKVFTKRGRQRNYIRRFEREGFQVKEARNADELGEFYHLYRKNLEHIGGYSKPYGFFMKIWRLLYPRNFRILLMTKQEEVLGALAFFIYKEKETVYAAYLGMNRKKLRRQKIGLVALWELVKWAQNNGFRHVNFGETPSNPDSIYYSLKKSLGASFTQQQTLYIPFNHKLFLLRTKVSTFLKSVGNRLPISLKKLIKRRIHI